MPPTSNTEIAAAREHLRDDGVDVVRVSYSDRIGADRGRDVLLEELPGAAKHGLAFCRAVYHTSPVGDVVPVQGGAGRRAVYLGIRDEAEPPQDLEGCGYDPARSQMLPMRLSDALDALQAGHETDRGARRLLRHLVPELQAQ